MHILVLYQYFHSPDAPGTGRHYSFVRRWAERHRVTVVTSRSAFTAPLTSRYPAAPEGVQLVSFPVPYANRMGIVRRINAFQHFARKAVRFGARCERPDVVFGTSTPLTVAWAARKIANGRGVPWIFEVRDLWPDFPIQMGAVPGRWLQERLRHFERGLYRDADHVITLSPDMEEHVLENGGRQGRVTTLVNGTSFELLDASGRADEDVLRQRHGLGDRQIVLYAGSLGRANGIPTLLETARQLRSRADLVFVFIGEGYHAAEIAEAAASEPNIVFLPPLPKHEIFAWHRLADLSLVTFVDKPVLAANSPSKFFDSLACGTPVVVTNPGWTRRFVEEHRCGWGIDTLDAGLLVSTISAIFEQPEARKERGRNGEAAAREHFDRQGMADRIETIMTRLVDESRSA